MKELIQALINQGIITAIDIQRMTSLELLLTIIERVNELHGLTKEGLEAVQRLLDKGVQEEVIAKLEEWTQDGTFDMLINQTALKTVNDRIDESNAQLSQTTNLANDHEYILNQSVNRNIAIVKGIDFNSSYFRIPFLTVTKHGTLIVGSDVRYNGPQDHGYIDLGVKRSTDGGYTWSDTVIAMRNNRVDNTYSRVMDGTIIYDESQDTLFLLGNYFDHGDIPWHQETNHKPKTWDVKISKSFDDGLTWSNPISIRDLCPAGYTSFIGGVGSGIVMENGTLVFPIQLNPMIKPQGTNRISAGIIYSRDKGATWNISSSFINGPASECNVVEYASGKLMLNARNDEGAYRKIYTTSDMGASWVFDTMSYKTQQLNACMGSMIKIPYTENGAILFSSPTQSTRTGLCLSVLTSNEKGFVGLNSIYPWTYDGYSCLAFDKWNAKLYIALELGGNIWVENITYCLKDIKKLKGENCEIVKRNGLLGGMDIYVSNDGDDANSGKTRSQALRTFTRIPEIVNDYYQNITIKIDSNYDREVRLSNIKTRTRISSIDGSGLNIKKLYIRECSYVQFDTPITLIEPFSATMVVSIENSNVFFNGKMTFNESSKASNLIFADNANVNCRDLNVASSTTAGIGGIINSGYMGGRHWVQVNELPYPIAPIAGTNSGTSNVSMIYRESGKGVKLNNGTISIVGTSLASDSRISYNQFINGEILGEKVEHMAAGNRIYNTIKDSNVICNWRFKPKAGQTIISGELLFTLPVTLRPRTEQRAVLAGIVGNTSTNAIHIQISTSGEVTAYGSIPANTVEIGGHFVYPL